MMPLDKGCYEPVAELIPINPQLFTGANGTTSLYLAYRYDLFEAPVLSTGVVAPRNNWRRVISVDTFAQVVFNSHGLITSIMEKQTLLQHFSFRLTQETPSTQNSEFPQHSPVSPPFLGVKRDAAIEKQSKKNQNFLRVSLTGGNQSHAQNKYQLCPPPACRPLIQMGIGIGSRGDCSSPFLALSSPPVADAVRGHLPTGRAIPTAVSYHQNAQESHPLPFCGIPYPHHPWQHASLNADGHPVGSSYPISQPLRRGDNRLDGPPLYSLAGVSVVGVMREQVDPELCLGGPAERQR